MTDPRTTRIVDRLRERGYYELARRVAEECHVTVVQVASRRKKKSHVVARHMLWYRIYSDGRMSFTELAEMFECDHTTILYGVHKCIDLDIAKPIVNDDNEKAEVA